MKTYEKLKQFCEHELEDYYSTQSYEIRKSNYYSKTDEYDSYVVEIKNYVDRSKELEFRVYHEDLRLMINLDYDSDYWEECEHYNSTVKYFWMAYLDWPG